MSEVKFKKLIYITLAESLQAESTNERILENLKDLSRDEFQDEDTTSINDFKTFFSALEEKGALGRYNLGFLKEILQEVPVETLEEVKKNDLLEKVKTFEDSISTVGSLTNSVKKLVTGGGKLLASINRGINIKWIIQKGVEGIHLVYVYQLLYRNLQVNFRDIVLPAGITLLNLYTGSICFMVQARSVQALKELWKWYQNGSLHKSLDKFLVTEEVKKITEGQELVTSVKIDEDEYRNACLDLLCADVEDNQRQSEEMKITQRSRSLSESSLNLKSTAENTIELHVSHQELMRLRKAELLLLNSEEQERQKCLKTKPKGKRKLEQKAGDSSGHPMPKVRRTSLDLSHLTDLQSKSAAWFAAAEGGNVEVVQALLSHGVDVNVTDWWGQTALFAAASRGNVEVVQTLLTHGVDVNLTDQRGQTALFAAASVGNVEVVQVLLSHGVDVNVTDELGQTALFAAARVGNAGIVQTLLSHGGDVNVTDYEGQTALFAAAGVGNVEVVRVLLSHGVDVNVTDELGQTALFAAARVGNAGIVQTLLSHGGDVNVTDYEGQTALFAAAGVGNVEVVQALLSHGVDVNVTDELGQTALFAAARVGSAGVVQTLLSHGVDVNVTDELGQTALFAAVRVGNVEVVRTLLSHGVDVNLTDKQGQTALFPAVQKGNLITLDSLVKHGASTSVVDNTGNPALFYTAQFIVSRISIDIIIKIVKFLMSNGASADARNVAGETLLLHYFSYSRMANIDGDSVHTLTMVCQFLVETKVDVNVRTHSGHSVIHLALLLLTDILKEEKLNVSPFMQKVQESSKSQIANSLLKFICSILSCPSCFKRMAASRDDDGNTPLHLWTSLPCPREWSTAEDDDTNATDTALHTIPDLAQGTKTQVPSHGAQVSVMNEEQSTVEDDDLITTETASSPESILSDIATQLLSHGAKVNAQNGDGETPLHMAQTWNAAKFLLDKGALPNVRDLYGNTPLLHHVRQKAHQSVSTMFNEVYHNMKAETVKMQWQEILNSGMDPWKGNDEGTTILSALLQIDAFDIIQAFLEAPGATYGKKYPLDCNGDTPLHVICRDSGRDSFWKLNLIDYLVPSSTHIANCANRKGKTALHIVCQRRSDDPLSCEIILRLRAYGARVDFADGEGKTCLDIAEDKPELMTLLTRDIKLFETDPWLPWSSKSEKHKDLLAQVARGQHAHQTGSVYYHTTPIGSGAFGYVYAGLDSKDGREVAVKRVEKVRMCRPEDHREIKNLLRLTDCEQVVQYLSYHGDQDFLYIVLELMEGTLEELLDGEVKEEEVSLCKDVLSGLTFLHQNNIIHRDIKPGNILYKHNPNLSLKLAGFGLSAMAANIGVHTTKVMHSKAGTRCWMAPELLRGTEQHSKASDVFACGLVLHYLLSRKKHPFGPENESGKSHFVIQHETEANILNNKLTVDGDLSPEAQDLVKLMVNCNKDDRSSADEALRHPLFWSNHKKAAFLTAVGGQPEVLSPLHFAYPLSSVKQDLENALGPQFARNPWDGEVPQIYTEMTLSSKSKKYVTSSAVDLLRFVRNTYAHVNHLTEAMKTSVLNDYVFFSKFPTLVMDVYKAVTGHKWDKRKAIASAMATA